MPERKNCKTRVLSIILAPVYLVRKEASTSWEDRCRRCGVCCHEKTIRGNEVVYDLDSWCEFYDPQTKRCRVYSRRLVEQVRCRRITRFRAMFSSYLPPECGYVQWASSRHLRFAPHRRIRYTHSGDADEDDSYHL
ncbi:MAG: hypothetical protein ACQEQU_08340 [Spirochaetota bacterium]